MISEKYKVVLLDIEGTTSAIDFVHTTMFDYARNNLEGFLDSSFETKETIDALEVFAQNENCPTLAVFLERTSSSYENIANNLCVDASEILFLSDVTEELDAAKTAGMGTGLLIRPGNKPAGNNEHIAYHDFNTL